MADAPSVGVSVCKNLKYHLKSRSLCSDAGSAGHERRRHALSNDVNFSPNDISGYPAFNRSSDYAREVVLAWRNVIKKSLEKTILTGLLRCLEFLVFQLNF